MQFEGADDVFRALADGFAGRWLELGRDGRCQHTLQDLAQFGAGAVAGVPAHQVGDEGLRNAGVDVVVRHLIGVERTPAEGEFREVAGADDDAAALIRGVEEDLRAFPGLGVLEGDVRFAVVPQVGQVLAHRGADGHFQQLRAGGGGEPPRRFDGVRRCSRPGHRQCAERVHAAIQQVRGVETHQVRQRGVQAAGDADDETFGAGRGHSAGESCGLDGEDLAGSGIQLGLVGGHERLAFVGAGERWKLRRRADRHGGWRRLARAAGEGVVAGAVVAQALAVHFHAQLRAVEREARRFAEQVAVLGGDQMAAEHHVLGGFGRAGGGVDVGGDGARALQAHEVAPVVRLADQLGAGGEVEQDFRAAQGEVGARRLRRPQVLAQLDAEGRLVQGEELVRAQGEPARRRVDFCGNASAGCEPAFLVELLVVGLGDLRHGAEDASVAADEGAVQQAAVGHPPRGADDQRAFVRASGNGGQRIFGGAAQIVAEEQVLAGVAGDGEFREQHDGGVRRSVSVGGQNGVRVGGGIGNGHRRRDGGDLQEPELGVVHAGASPRRRIVRQADATLQYAKSTMLRPCARALASKGVTGRSAGRGDMTPASVCSAARTCCICSA